MSMGCDRAIPNHECALPENLSDKSQRGKNMRNAVKRGKVIVLVAPSGAGKTSIVQRLIKDYGDKIKFSVSATTRPPRPEEVTGVHYHFLSKEDFDTRIAHGDFLEWAEFYNGRQYGTLRSAVENLLDASNFVLLDIEVKGAMNVKSMYGDQCLTIFIKPPSLEVLK